MKQSFVIFALGFVLFSCKSETKQNKNPAMEEKETNTEIVSEEDSAQIDIEPISHATAVINWDGTHIYLDPTGGAEAFGKSKEADLVLITDIHGDHLNAETLAALDLGDTPVIVPQAVKEELPDTLDLNLVVMENGETIDQLGFSIEAIPMYNLREEAQQFHPKGRGNGYLLEKDGKRLYIAGDTEDIPEMRNLENIDIALVPMNLPYTMTVESAADAVLDFAPKKVYPYHFRSSDGFSDVEKFEQIINDGNKEIEVIMVDWYPDNPEF